ncbi:PLP-dependent transferase, partial [Nocardia cyriacigeorgica]|uniref:PLP-dependent transferase n=1 Tax=Nocardia cyriacigeorgica TaxID=135487 RepID=UPI002453DA73
GGGVMVWLLWAGGVHAANKFVDAPTLHTHVPKCGHVRSLVIHPASTTHSQLTPDQQLAAGVTPGLVRLAVGIEGINDILTDLRTGFDAAR